MNNFRCNKFNSLIFLIIVQSVGLFFYTVDMVPEWFRGWGVLILIEVTLAYLALAFSEIRGKGDEAE